MIYDALIIIDMQEALINAHPWNEQTVTGNVLKLLNACRCKGVPVIYIRHDGGKGDELEKGGEGWQVCRRIAPAPGETIIDKRFNSMFKGTELDEYLTSIGANRLILCGMQTEYCFDVSCKVAFEHGYRVTVPRGTVTTFDSDFSSAEELTRYFEDRIWNGRYASVKDAAEVLAGILEE